MIENLNIIITIILIFSSVMVIFSYNPINSALFLILSYVSATVSLLLLKAEFIALILITIYAGAVVVIFIFVILMIDIKNYTLISYYIIYNIILSFIFLIEIIFLIFENFNLNAYSYNNFFLTNFFRNWIFIQDISVDIEILGQILSTNFAIHLLIAGLILFLSVLSCVFLTFNFKTKKIKLQIIFRQLSKNYNKNLV